MKVYRSQEDLQKQKEYLQSQCRKDHRKLNGKLREEIEELEKINKLMYEHP